MNITTVRCLWRVILWGIVCGQAAVAAMPRAKPQPTLDCYISTGDSHFLGASLAVDSRATIEAAFDMFKNALGIRRVYWRGLQEATTIETLHLREENFRYATAVKWFRHLIRDVDIEPMAARIAHDRGLEFWGVGTLGDWGCSADTPGFNDFPWFWESTLRLEHPEWAPVDKYGYRRQGGVIELAYPEARKALVDLHTRLAVRAGYDGIIFLSYVENFSQRFQDEFGYSKPIVDEFKRRYGIDIRTQPFNRYASRTDWYKLRGEYVTQYLRELKASLKRHGIKLGMFVNPRTPRLPGNWATLSQEYYTLGHIYFDLETWVREGIVDELVVYGGADRRTQAKTVRDCLWLTRGTQTRVSLVTSSPSAEIWRPLRERGVPAVLSVGEDHDYFLRGGFPKQPSTVLRGGSLWQKMGLLSQVIAGQSKVPAQEVTPYARHENVLMRRLAVHALGVLRDPAAVPVIERGLDDPENGVRCKAMQALRYNHGPQSAAKILATLAQHGEHPLHEMARDTLARIRPAPRRLLRNAAGSPNPVVRTTAIRAMRLIGPREEDVAWLRAALNDPHRYARYAAAMALGAVRSSTAAAEALVDATRHTDVAVADRAAASIEALVRRRDPAVEALRPRMLHAVEELFMKMGGGCKRDDAEWGYRVSGNALLAFGQEGESFLRGLMSQSRDRRLAELAWRVLYFREKAGANAFNIIPESESDAAFQKRPLWLKTMRATRLAESFDSPERFGPGAQGTIGDSRRIRGRWGTFGPAGVRIDSKVAHSRPHSAKLVRGAHGLYGYTAAGVRDGRDYEVLLWIYRDTDTSAFVLNVKGRSQAGPEVAAFVDAEGRVRLRDTARSEWVDTRLRVEPRVWTRLRLIADRTAGRCRVAVMPQEKAETISNVSVPLRAKSGLYLLKFSAQPPEGASVHLDDIELVERF